MFYKSSGNFETLNRFSSKIAGRCIKRFSVLRTAREALSMLGETLLYHFSWQSYSDFQTIIFFDYYFIIFLVAADPRSPSQLRFFDLGLISRNFLLLSRKQKKVPKIPLGNSYPYRAANADPKVFLW
jgi:hypothetical protein